MSALKDQRALIFAGSRGIGRGTAIQLAEKGAIVGIGYAGNEQAAEATMETVREAGGEAFIFQTDVAERKQVEVAFDQITKDYGGVDIVINAAAVSFFEPLATIDPAKLEKSVAVNVRGAFNVLQEAANRVTNGGRIIQFSTGGTKMPVPGGGVYAATKAGGENMALALAKELGECQITVNVISPGMTDTDGLIMPQDQIDMLVAQTPLGRLGQPTDVANVVAFLVSPEAGWITGQNIQANGGIL